MSVSVKRSGPGSWHELGKDSEPQQNGNKVALLSDVVLIQLVRASQDDPSPSSGLSASKFFLFHFAKKKKGSSSQGHRLESQLVLKYH